MIHTGSKGDPSRLAAIYSCKISPPCMTISRLGGSPQPQPNRAKPIDTPPSFLYNQDTSPSCATSAATEAYAKGIQNKSAATDNKKI